jgi:hypothetical protein
MLRILPSAIRVALTVLTVGACSHHVAPTAVQCETPGPAEALDLTRSTEIQLLEEADAPLLEEAAATVLTLNNAGDSVIGPPYTWGTSALYAGVNCDADLSIGMFGYQALNVTALASDEDDETYEEDESFNAVGPSRKCRLWLATIGTDGKMTAKHVVLEAEVGVQVPTADVHENVTLSTYDIDGDGVAEVVARWETEGPIRPGTGPITTIALAFADSGSLTPRWSAETRLAGASVDPECESTVTLQDIDCDGHRDVRFDVHCYDGACTEAQENADAEEIAEYCGKNMLNEDTKTTETTRWPAASPPKR